MPLDNGEDGVGLCLVPQHFTVSILYVRRTNFNVYDFPGFSDTRGSCSDIVTASVLQMVARSASSIKVVLVVPFDSVRSGSDRLGFVSLLRHATAFIKKPLKYQSSVGLVVTKVPNVIRKVKGVRLLVSDNDMRRTVVSFLREVNGTLDTLKQSKSDPEEFYPAASQLISNILEKEGDEYPRIGLFRTPEEEGLLSELEPMQEAKSALQNLFYNVLTPTVPDDDDFGLPLSDVAKFSVQRLHSNFASRLEGHVAKIALALKEHYRVRRQQLLDIAAVREQSSRDRQHLAQALNRLLPGNNTNSSVSTPREFLRRLLAAVREVHQGAPAVDFLASLNDTAVLELLEDATPEEMQNLRPEQWSQPLQDLMSYVDGVELWYRTLDTLETALSAYEVQGDKDLKRRIRQKHESRGNKELNPLFSVLTAVNGGNFDSFDLAKLQPDAEMVRDLDLLVNATLYPEPLQSNCVQERSGWSLKIRGRYIWMSDVLKEVRAGCEQHISAVHILAEHSLFIDADLYLNNEESKVRSPALLYIFSPRWQVLGDHTLSVDGLPGADCGPPPKWYSPGSDGLAGLPGGAGGSIVALGDEVLDGHRLQLSASGGAGGRGQNGKDGLQGAIGRDATIDSGYRCSDHRHEDGAWNFGLGYLWGSTKGFTCGGSGGSGHDGGAGGVGGQGGQAGSIRLLPINVTSSENRPTLQLTVKTRQTQGRRGAAGRGGAGGEAGTDGAMVEYTDHYFFFIKYKSKDLMVGINFV
ncbi:uncharacterized protein LOC127751522 [Frankliniella occidentalis]|uniref:Uncharacterized protein LOC127751522 n=1 Tax=Frankliniella occidentalis TaxID=133901 RepID=A0A9C6XTW0_FRAOC|nr:uncharacterized protein LOC127751522 [Frankliniella occidentalis]